MAAGRVPKRADWRVADGVRVEELDGSWLALDPAGGVVYRLEARAAEVMRLVAHRLPLPGHLVPAARELAGHGVLEHPLVDRRTALVGAGVVTLTGLAATILPSAVSAASNVWDLGAQDWPVTGGTAGAYVVYTQEDVFVPSLNATRNYYIHTFTTSHSSANANTLRVLNPGAITDVSILIVAGGGGGGRGQTGAGGGGGGGGVLSVTGADLQLGNYAVTVGAGGLGRAGSSGPGLNGEDSSIELGEAIILIAKGGGGGGGPSTDNGARDGGSGGGGGADDGSGGDDVTGGGKVDGTAIITGGTDVFSGNAGGSGANTSPGVDQDERRAGGGGGAGGAGTNGVRNSTAGNGGAAGQFSAFVTTGADAITGFFAGGGGGAGGAGSPSSGAGIAGTFGGNGGYGTGSTNAAGKDGVANRGGGGGGSTDDNDGGDGGSGIVLVRYRLL